MGEKTDMVKVTVRRYGPNRKYPEAVDKWKCPKCGAQQEDCVPDDTDTCYNCGTEVLLVFRAMRYRRY